MISRSNCANESRICSVSRPMELLVEVLCHGHKAHVALLKERQQTCEVEERSAEPVHLIDHDAIDPVLFHIVQQALQCWPFETGPTPSAVVIPCRHRLPAFAFMTGNVRFRGFPLRL